MDVGAEALGEWATAAFVAAYVGLVQVFVEACYDVVASPTLRRRVVRRILRA